MIWIPVPRFALEVFSAAPQESSPVAATRESWRRRTHVLAHKYAGTIGLEKLPGQEYGRISAIDLAASLNRTPIHRDAGRFSPRRHSKQHLRNTYRAQRSIEMPHAGYTRTSRRASAHARAAVNICNSPLAAHHFADATAVSFPAGAVTVEEISSRSPTRVPVR